MTWLRRILTVVFTALLLFSAYKIYEYVREARESEASVETLIEKAVEERTPKEPGSLCAFLKGVKRMSTYQKEHMEMEYARHFLRALKLLEEAQRGNEDPDTLINGLLQAATEFYDADSHILSKRIGRQALA